MYSVLDAQTPLIQVCDMEDLRNERFPSGARPYECGVCKKSYRHLSYFYTHKKIHTGVKPHSCGICGKSFLLKKYLQRLTTVKYARNPLLKVSI